MPKLQPAIQTFEFNIQPGQTNYIDLMQVASLMNRRAYRQGFNVAVAGFTLLSNTPGNLLIEKLPNTWVLSASWEKAFRAWKRQQDEVMEDGNQQSVKARWNDFKVYFDPNHFAVGNTIPTSTNLPSPGAGTNAEWDYSQVVIPNYAGPGINYEPYLHMLGGVSPGGSPPSIGLIQAYANSRAVPTSPDPDNVPGITGFDNVYRNMFDVGDNNDAVLDNVIAKNDALPYDQDNYPGMKDTEAELVDFMKVTVSTIGGMTRGRGSTFPCGLIKINALEMDATSTLLVHLVPGPARGYLAETMVDM